MPLRDEGQFVGVNHEHMDKRCRRAECNGNFRYDDFRLGVDPARYFLSAFLFAS